MRSLLMLAAVVIVVGAFVAGYVDKAIVNSNLRPSSSSSSEAMTATSAGRNLASLPASNSFPNPASISSPPQSATPKAPPQPALPQVVTLTRSVTLRDDGTGHFRATGRIDGVRIEFLVDTGASMVTLRQSTAGKLGFHPMEREFSVQTQTANGVGRAALIRLNMVELDSIVVRDVQAFVLPDNLLNMNLLGMTFLSRLRWTHDRGKLVIEQ